MSIEKKEEEFVIPPLDHEQVSEESSFFVLLWSTKPLSANGIFPFTSIIIATSLFYNLIAG